VQSDVSKANDRESNTTAGSGGNTQQFEGPNSACSVKATAFFNHLEHLLKIFFLPAFL